MSHLNLQEMLRRLGAPGHVLGNVDDGVEDLRRVGGVGGLQRALPGRTGRHLNSEHAFLCQKGN